MVKCSRVATAHAIAIYPGIRASHQFFIGAAVVHGEVIKIDRGVATLQGTEINGFAIDTAAQQQLVHLVYQLKPGSSMRIHALAQRRTRRNGAKTQCTPEEGAISKALDGIEITFTHAQQGEVGFENLAVGYSRSHSKLLVDQRIDIDALETFADKSQSGMGTEVVGQLFDNKVGHVRIHLLGEQYM